MAAGWSSPHTSVRFYNLDVNTAPGLPGSFFLSQLCFLGVLVYIGPDLAAC